MAKSEQDIQKEILNFLKSIGAYAIKIIRANENGVLDIVSCLKSGRFLTIEVKFGYNKPTKLQKHHLNKVRECGGLSICVWSLDELKEYLLLHGEI